MPQYDAIVIGGGPAGATAACLLAEAGWSTALLERQIFPRGKVCGEFLSASNWPLLERVGMADALAERGGPAIRRVGLFAGPAVLSAALPVPKVGGPAWGRAIDRSKLDSWLLQRARAAGAEVHQPATATHVERRGQQLICKANVPEDRASIEMAAPIVVAAHGSWSVGPSGTGLPERPARPGDLLGFKAHFRSANLPPDLMPLVCFPGGYGGMVTTDEGRLSLSCCIRRDKLQRLARKPGQAAGAAVLEHIKKTTVGVARALASAELVDHWLAAGPIRPGVRWRYSSGVLRVGNAAGEAHPAVAEGISMALQSAALAAGCLIQAGHDADAATLESAGRQYAALWKRQFAPRVHAAAAIAHWAMRPALVGASMPLLRALPTLLTWGAYTSGKTMPLPFSAQAVHS